MKVYYDYEREKLLTEKEAREYTAEDVWEDEYGIWEFITEHYSCSEIMEELPRDFIEEVGKAIIERRLNSEEHFCVRDFPN